MPRKHIPHSKKSKGEVDLPYKYGLLQLVILAEVHTFKNGSGKVEYYIDAAELLEHPSPMPMITAGNTDFSSTEA